MNQVFLKNLVNSPVSVFALTHVVLAAGLVALLNSTETLLLPSLFFAVMFPAVISSVIHLKAPVLKFEKYCMEKLAHGF